MKAAVVDGDTEMVGMLIDAKADVGKRDINVSVCIYGIACLLYVFCMRGLLYLHGGRTYCIGREPHLDRGCLGAQKSIQNADKGDS